MVALLDFGGVGTSITLADAASAFDVIGGTVRIPEFAGDQIDQALLSHVLDGVARGGDVDPGQTAAVGDHWRGCGSSAARPRSGCLAKPSPA